MNPYPSDPAVSGYVTTLTPLTEEVHGLELRVKQPIDKLVISGTALTCQCQVSSLDHTSCSAPSLGYGSQLLMPSQLLPQPGMLQELVPSSILQG
jgi:hypothetical protein